MVVREIGEGWNLENTPTWAVATVCTVFVTTGWLIVFAIEKIEHRLKHAQRRPLVQALQRMKEELMLLGFISLLLAVFQNYVASVCVDTDVLKNWSPCRVKNEGLVDPSALDQSTVVAGRRRRLLAPDSWPMMNWGDEPIFRGRILIQSEASPCKPGRSPFASIETLHQLHTFIFVLACVHILYSLFAMLLASTKVNRWKVWEEEAHKETHDSMREVVKSLSLRRQTTFIKYHTSKKWSTNRFFIWITCFCRQFGDSVVHSDYLSLRLGFITNHNLGRKFDFHGYMIRSLEDEYQKIVGISVPLWIFVIVFMLFNIAGANLFFYLSLVPAVLVLLVGAKLQHVIATLALENAGFSQCGRFAGTVKPRDELFWFNKPQLVLALIHFVLFQNAFEMSTFLSFTWQFGYESCLLRNKLLVFTRIAIGAIVQVICSYKTLPLYALVTQMGSHYKHSIFGAHVKDKLHIWRKSAKKRLRHGTSLAESQDGSMLSSDKRGKDYNSSPDEASFETIHEKENDELIPRLENLEHFVSSPQSLDLRTREISIRSAAEGRPFLIPEAPRPSYTRAMSAPKAPARKISRKFHKQLSFSPTPSGTDSDSGYIELLNLQSSDGS